MSIQGRQSWSEARGNSCIQEKESCLALPSTGGRACCVVWWKYLCLADGSDDECSLHCRHTVLSRRTAQSLDLITLYIFLSRFGERPIFALLIHFQSDCLASQSLCSVGSWQLVIFKICLTSVVWQVNNVCPHFTFLHFPGITGRKWWQRRSKPFSGRPTGRWTKDSECEVKEAMAASQKNRGDEPEHQAACGCGSKRTYLRGLSLHWLICL